MVPDEQVIVLGGGDDGIPDLERRPGRRSSPVWLLLAVLGLFVSVIAFVVVPQEETPTTAQPGGLDAPPEPPSAFVQTTVSLPSNVPDLALGWRQATLFRPGWQVNSVDHGPDGWLAVSGQVPTIAHVSDNAVLWHAHTVRGLTVENAVAAVGEGLMAIFGSNQYEQPGGERAVGAISRDRGSTWSTIGLDGLVSVSDVQIVDGRVLVAGSIGTVPGFQWNNEGRAALWEVIDGRLVDLGLDTTNRSRANAIVVGPDSEVRVFGHTDEGATVWTAGNGERTAMPEIDPLGSRTFLDVEILDPGLVALVGVPGSTEGRWLWTSRDGTVWEETGTTWDGPVSSIAVGPRGLFGLPVREGRLWWGVGGTLRSTYPDLETGWENAGLLSDLEIHGDIMVMTGAAASGQLFVRGTVLPPIEVVTPLVGGEPRWRTVASVDLEGDELSSHAYPFAAVTSGRSTFVAVPGRLYEVVETEAGVELRPSISGLSNIGSGNAGIWATVEGAESQLYLYGSDGVWSTQIVPMQGIASVGELNDALTVAGWGNQGFAALRMTDDGSWEELTPGGGLGWFQITPGGLVGEVWPVDGSAERPDAAFSPDGVQWNVLDGWRTAGSGGVPFLASTDDPNVIALADTAPDLVGIDIPVGTAPTVAVERWQERLLVMGADSLFFRSGDEEWQEIPVDLEHGVTGQAVIVPGAEIRIAMITGGQLVIAEWG